MADNTKYCSVILDQGVGYPLEYEASLEVSLGCRVQVLVRKRSVIGTVVEIYAEKKTPAPHPLIEVVGTSAIFTQELYQLANKIAFYWCTPLRKVMQTMLPKAVKKDVKLKKKKDDPIADSQFFPAIPKALSDEQTKAFNAVKDSLDKKAFATHLLYGVTGSGKTEVYIRLIEHALSLQRGVIVLVPEIALTEQTIERFRSRFQGEKIAILHHRLSEGERNYYWREIFEGNIRFVIGARSAIFSPVQNLGLIVIDEEHTASYKSEEMPTYHARDVAIIRAHAIQATVLLGSATPSFESYKNAQSGKYQLHTLSKRPLSAALPKVELVDMQQDKEKGVGIFSSSLINKMANRLKNGEQTILFLNRRGYHTQLHCTSCSNRIDCPSCAVPLTFHRSKDELLCHLCSYRSPAPRCCPKCQSPTIKFRGIGTEQVERALHALFPEAKTLRIDADTTKEKGQHASLFKQFATGKADILVGTQMVSKGLHFPHVTLVGVLNADQQLYIPDFRSAELTFQQLIQVAGRSGRGSQEGEVLLQTHQKDSPVITLALQGDFDAFYREEIKSRELFSYPPFGKLAKFSFRGPDEKETHEFAQNFRSNLISLLPPSVKIYPITPSGHSKVQDQFRYQLLLFADSHTPLQRLVQEGALDSLLRHKSVKIRIDIDPLSTYF